MWQPPIAFPGDARPLAGTEQTWHPTYSGPHWPHPEGQNDLIPEPCPRCGGEVVRRYLIVNAGEIAQTEYRNAKEERLAKAEHRAPTLAPIPEPRAGWLYELRHYRKCNTPAGAVARAVAGQGEPLPLRPMLRVAEG